MVNYPVMVRNTITMVSVARAAAFIGIFLPISILPAYYVLLHVFVVLGFNLGIYFWIGVIILGLSFLFGMGLAAVNDNPKLRGVNIALGVWVGFILILLFLLMFFDIIGLFYHWPNYQTAGMAVMLIAAVLTCAGAANATVLRTRKVKIPGPGLKKPMRIVLLSDLHLGPVHDLKYFKKVIARTNEQDPDLVLITGDLIDGRLSKEVFAPIDDIKAPVYFSKGNHEQYAGWEDIEKFLSGTKAKVLVNTKVDLGSYELAGIDFDWSAKAFDKMIDQVRPTGEKYAILMSHGPPAFDAARKTGFDLTLSGHTHGGQFWPFTMFGRLFVKYRVGIYERDGKYLFVTSGTGTWGPPIRLGVNSELAVIDIETKGKKRK
jgi:predicted MPP superfamily phosphohydrolase